MIDLRQGSGRKGTLESLAPCFQGLIPAVLYTCSADGIPNAAYLSHVEYVDPAHVALSFQFFNKSRRNIAENPNAFVTVLDPDTSQGWCLRLRYVRSEDAGPLFDRMALRIEAIASYCGLKGIFKLLAADVYEVLSIARSEEERGRPEASSRSRRRASDPVFTMKALQDLSERIHGADSLEGLLDSILEVLEGSFGFSHSMILVPAEEPGVLVTIATRGYPENGAGAEARHGEGIIGMVAEARKPIRISGLIRGMLYAYAVHKRAQEQGLCPPERRIPLPGLAQPESQLGIPLLVRSELVGVLCLESDVPYRFHEEDKATIELLGSYLAIAIQNIQLQDAAYAASTPNPIPTPTPNFHGANSQRANSQLPAPNSQRAAGRSAPGRTPDVRAKARREVVYYADDECIFVDGEYLIRSLPAKILWKLLETRDSQGRTEFTNRELRLDKSLKLPEWKDNLESRLLLLRRRLEQKVPDIRIVPRGRGRFALELGSELALSTRP